MKRFSPRRVWAGALRCVVLLGLCLPGWSCGQAVKGSPAPRGDAATQADPEPRAADALAHDLRPARRVVAWHPIGSNSPDPAVRHVGWGLPKSSWPDYVRTLVRPQLDAGVRRVMLHNPFGRTALNQPMAFDQYLEARDAGLPWLTDGFVEAWTPVIDGTYTGGEPVEVICYLGSLDTDTDMKALLGDPAAWDARADASVAPALAAGMSVAVDSSNDYPADSAEFAYLQRLADAGTRVYIEPRPRANCPHLFGFPIVTTRQHWFRSNPDRHPGAQHNAPNDLLTGEVVLIIKGVGKTPQRQSETRRLLAETGCSVAVVLNRQVSRNLPLARWVEQGSPRETAPEPAE